MTLTLTDCIRECIPLCSSTEELLECVESGMGRALLPTEAARVRGAWVLRAWDVV